MSQVRRHPAEREFVVGDTEDVVVRTDDRGPAAMAVEPGCEHAVFFSDGAVAGLVRRASRTDADHSHAKPGQACSHIRGQIGRASSIQHQPPSGCRGGIEKAPPFRSPDPGLRKQRAVRRMERERQQTFLQRRDDLLAGDGAGNTAAFARMRRSRASATTGSRSQMT